MTMQQFLKKAAAAVFFDEVLKTSQQNLFTLAGM